MGHKSGGLHLPLMAGRITTMLPAGGQVFESYEIGDDTFHNTFGTAWFGQTFTPDTNHTVDKIWLKLSKEGSPGTCTVSIRATAAMVPTGGDLAVATRDGDLFIEGDIGEWYEFNLSTGVALTASTLYSIVVRSAGADTDNDVKWRTDAGGGYTVGDHVLSSDSGGSWVTGVQDNMFKEGVA